MASTTSSEHEPSSTPLSTHTTTLSDNYHDNNNDNANDNRVVSNDTTDLDLEKQDTARSAAATGTNFPSTAQSRGRLTRTQSLTRPRVAGRFSHPLSHVKTSEADIVDFDSASDPYRPVNWPFRKKVITTVLYGLTTTGTTWATAVYAPAVEQIAGDFHVSNEVSLLGVTFLMLGLAIGPMIFAPLSEIYGRKPAVLIPYFLAAMFSLGTASAKDIQTVLITRFFAGLFGSAPVTNTGGVLGDIWAPQQRGNALVGYAFAVVSGPTLGPIAGSAIVNSYLRWRWTEYTTVILMLTTLILDVLILDETYPPALLVAKARRLRHETGNWALHARHEEWDVSVSELAHKFGARPFQLLVTPICFLMALYASFVYGLLYLFLAAVPIQFGAGGRNWSPVMAELPFLAFLLGVVFAGAENVYNNRFYIRKFEANGNKAVPEARLPPMMIGGVFFAAGLFVFGWTSDPKIHWIAPVLGVVCMGFGFFTIFQAALNYLVDSFQKYAASAIAANTFLRSIFGGIFPLFVRQMFHNLGMPWASSVLGFISVLLIPIPYVFYLYGARIRARGKYTISLQN